MFLITADVRKAWKVHQSINPRMKKAKTCCGKRMRRSSKAYFEHYILKHQYFLSPKDGWFGQFWSTCCLFYMRWRFATKVGKTPPSTCGTTILLRAWLHELGCFGVPRSTFSPVLHDEPCWACLMDWAGPANAITWKNLSPVSRYPGTAIPCSRLTGLARLSCNREVDFCCV